MCVAALTKTKQFYAVLGGMHLLRASRERIERTEAALREYKLQRIGPAHCTGTSVIRRLGESFSGLCFTCTVGSEARFQRIYAG